MNNTSKNKTGRYGEGSIFQRSDGRFVSEICIGIKPDGNVKRKTIYGKTAAEVNRKLQGFKKDFYKNGKADYSKESLQVFMERWLTTTKKLSIKPTSYDRLEATCKKQIFPELGFFQISAISPEDVQDFINKIGTEFSYSTTKKCYEALNACFKFAVKWEYIRRNPAEGITIPKINQKPQSEIKFFTDEQINQIKREAMLINDIDNKPVYHNGAIVPLLLNTGLRIGEAIALEWKDIDFERRFISISKNASYVKNRIDESDSAPSYKSVIQYTPKTKSSVRKVNINNTAYEALKTLQKYGTSSVYVFANSKGERVTHSSVNKMFRKIQEKCGIKPTLGPHAARHTFATVLFRNGVDVKTVSTLLGHSSTSITYNIYIHVINEQKAEAVKLLDEI